MNRRAAYLDAMGVGPVWLLRAAAPEAPVAEPEEVAPSPTQPVPPPPALAETKSTDTAWADAGPAAPVSDDAIAAMDWSQLRSAVASCTRCSLCRNGGKPVPGSGARQARWMVVAGASNQADDKARQPLAGDPGILLDNMMKAVGLVRQEQVYVTNLVKCRPVGSSGAERAPAVDEVAACRPFVEREIALSGAALVLSLGQIAANGLRGEPLGQPLAASRGTVHEVHGVPLVATLHPGELLRQGADKAQAWIDLCLASAGDVGTN